MRWGLHLQIVLFCFKYLCMGLFDFLKKKEPAPQPRNPLLEPVLVTPGMEMPQAIARHWQEIEALKLPCIEITATPSNDLALEQSKFGHYPCMPLDFDYPKDAEGKYMFPLAQINCKDIAALPGYPQSGYLQFYIAAYDDLMGLDFDSPQSQLNFRVLFFEESETVSYKADFSFLDEAMQSDMLPVHKPHALHFTQQQQYPASSDARIIESCALENIVNRYPDIQEELYEVLWEKFPAGGHRVGGYAYFAQEDPRLYNEPFKDYVLLLQIDSDDDIMWGDVGVANFFIHKDDLAQKDFSKVLYNWDCS
jgi:uncharacterized protein YwqG